MMRRLIFAAIIAVFLVSVAAAQTPCYYVFYGNPDGSTIDVYLDSDIRLNLWTATPAIGSGCEDLNGDGIVDSMIFIYTPLATNDSFIVSRDYGEVFDPFSIWCDLFMDPDSNTPPGYTTQTLFRSWGGPDCEPFSTNGDTLHVADFFMRTSEDVSLLGRTVCPFKEGYSPVNGGILWGLQDGTIPIIPNQTFSCLYFVDYLAGDANSSGDVTAADVSYLLYYCKGFGTPPDPFLGGDANGDCLVNPVDVTYLVAYFRGGPEPLLGNCH